jgi:hypothetical protein
MEMVNIRFIEYAITSNEYQKYLSFAQRMIDSFQFANETPTHTTTNPTQTPVNQLMNFAYRNEMITYQLNEFLNDATLDEVVGYKIIILQP